MVLLRFRGGLCWRVLASAFACRPVWIRLGRDLGAVHYGRCRGSLLQGTSVGLADADLRRSEPPAGPKAALGITAVAAHYLFASYERLNARPGSGMCVQVHRFAVVSTGSHSPAPFGAGRCRAA